MTENNNLKIVLVGPSLSGKTSLIDTMFLSFSNPSYYINNNSIPLTKHFEIFTFDYNGIKVGVFDLAGQENQLWFNENINIFNKADMIILVFAASEKIEVINSFLEYIHDIKKILDLNECKIVCLLHKCDLESETKIITKIKYFKNTLSYGKEIDFFMTSISQECYTKTFIVFSKILDFLNKKSIAKSEFRKIMSELKILLRLEERAYLFEKLRKKFNLKDERPLKILNKLGFIKKSGNYYIITERGLFFRKGINPSRISSIIPHYNTFLNFSECGLAVHGEIESNPLKFSKKEGIPQGYGNFLKEFKMNDNKLTLAIFSTKKQAFLRKLLEIFTQKQVIILNHICKNVRNKLTFYSPTGRSGKGLKHGFPPFDNFISIRNLATLLGINKNNLTALTNQYNVILKIEDSLVSYNRKTKGELDKAIMAFNDFISEIELDYLTYKIFRKYSNKEFSITQICRLLDLSSEGTIYKKANYSTIFSRLLNIYFLGNEVCKIGIEINSLKDLKKDCHDVCLRYLNSKKSIFSIEIGVENFDLIFFSLLVLNEKKGGKKPPSLQTSLSDLSLMLSLGNIERAKKIYLSGVLYRNSLIRWKILNKLITIMNSHLPNSSSVLDKIDKYLLKYYWRKFKPDDKGYHKYWYREELKISLRKYLIDETLGLDVNIFKFFELDNGDLIEIHHIFGNRESVFLKDLAPLLTFSHKSLTFSSYYKPETLLKTDNNIIFQRRVALKKFSSINYSKENEIIIRKSFAENALWKGISFDVMEQWITRWIDKKKMNEQEWYIKYKFNDLYTEYSETFSSPDLRSKFIFWYFKYFLPYHT